MTVAAKRPRARTHSEAATKPWTLERERRALRLLRVERSAQDLAGMLGVSLRQARWILSRLLAAHAVTVSSSWPRMYQAAAVIA